MVDNKSMSAKVKVLFAGGFVEINGGGKYIKDGVEKVSEPSVKIGFNVSPWGTVDPAIFKSLILTVASSEPAMKKLNEICQ